MNSFHSSLGMTSRFALWALLGGLLLTIGANHGTIQAGKHHGCDCCPECGTKICCPTPEVQKEKKHTWCVEWKEICIPGIKCPFFSCCCDPPPCGKVRTVNVLKKVEYECEKCGYKWEVQCVKACECGK